jgi:N-acetylglucosamine-6-phosphate deacetylase
MSVELILDGVHVHPGAVGIVRRCVGRRLVAISDASPFAGVPDGDYEWAGTTITSRGGALTDPHGHLAGAGRLLDAAPEALRQAGCSLDDVVYTLTVAPRRVLDPRRSDGIQVGDGLWVAGPRISGADL